MENEPEAPKKKKSTVAFADNHEEIPQQRETSNRDIETGIKNEARVQHRAMVSMEFGLPSTVWVEPYFSHFTLSEAPSCGFGETSVATHASKEKLFETVWSGRQVSGGTVGRNEDRRPLPRIETRAIHDIESESFWQSRILGTPHIAQNCSTV